MKYLPAENWVTVQPAPDLHQDSLVLQGAAIERQVSYSRRKADPQTGRWFRIVQSGDTVPPYFGPGMPVICNLNMVSDFLDACGEKVAQILYTQCAGTLIGEEMMQHFGTRHPILPVGDYVLLVANDDRHSEILGYEPSKGLHAPLQTLERGQRTDEPYETNVDESGWETPNPNRANDGVRALFWEVVSIGPEVPPGRIAVGDMAAFRPTNGIKFDFRGKSYRLVRCPVKNSEIMGRAPREEAAEMEKAS
jgi:hypothetical protein